MKSVVLMRDGAFRGRWYPAGALIAVPWFDADGLILLGHAREVTEVDLELRRLTVRASGLAGGASADARK